MTDSENHRPAVSLKQSPEAYISKRLEEAADLEQKLKASKKAEISAEIQSRLCEVFGDILISDPLAAKRNNVADRLWNTCFYRNISQLRSKISRAKRHKDSKGVRIMTKEFDSHCAGGIKLYEYLEGHFRSKILSQTNQSQTQDSGTQDSSVDSVEGISKSMEGVVESFSRVYIYLGDLHRYGEKFNKAEECYYVSFKLAPGKGNPYNQLGVVARAKDPKMSYNALYWHCRSILATHQSFSTSPANLQRLFDANRGNLKEFRLPKPPIYKPDEQAATKSCLAHFVDVFYVIVESRSANEVDEEAIRSKMSDVMASFESLLQVAAFSDALLFKLVQICAFVYEICRTMTPISKELSRDFLLMTGTTLAIPMNVILSRILAKGRGGSFRYLLPYQILCEYLSQIEESEGKEHDIFWKSFSEIASLILKLSIRDGVAPNSYVLDGDINVPLKEYQQLRGYRPFNFLYKSYAEGNPYISPEDAIDALDLLTSKASQEYVCTSALDVKTAKVSRFLAMCEEYAENEKFPVSFSGDRYVFVEKPVREEAQDEPIAGHNGIIMTTPSSSAAACTNNNSDNHETEIENGFLYQQECEIVVVGDMEEVPDSKWLNVNLEENDDDDSSAMEDGTCLSCHYLGVTASSENGSVRLCGPRPRFDGTSNDTKSASSMKNSASAAAGGRKKQRSDASLLLGLALTCQDLGHIVIKTVKIRLLHEKAQTLLQEQSSTATNRKVASMYITFHVPEVHKKEVHKKSKRGPNTRRFMSLSPKMLPPSTQLLLMLMRSDWDFLDAAVSNTSDDDMLRISKTNSRSRRKPSLFPPKQVLNEVYPRIGSAASLDIEIDQELKSRLDPGKETLASLPRDIMEYHVAVFLRPRSLDSLRRTCKSMHRNLCSVVPGLKLNLYSHQIKSLGWMRCRETQSISEGDLTLTTNRRVYCMDGDPHRAASGGASTLLLDRREGAKGIRISQFDGEEVIVQERDNPLSRMVARGGLLCDDPGLGKTITAVSLILQTLGLSTLSAYGTAKETAIDIDDEKKQEKASDQRIFEEYWNENLVPRDRSLAMLKFLNDLRRKNISIFGFFVEPVDPVTDSCPDYYEVIKEPLCFEVIREKVNKEEYGHFAEFERDTEKMFENDLNYFPPGNEVHEAAVKLRKSFRRESKELKAKTIKTAKRSFSRAAAKPNSKVAALVEKNKHAKMKNSLRQSSSTLLVVPAVLLEHWEEQLRLHVDVKYCTSKIPIVFEYSGTNKCRLKIEQILVQCDVKKSHYPLLFVDKTGKGKLPSAYFLSKFSVVLTTSQRFTNEWKKGSFEDELNKKQGDAKLFQKDDEDACNLLKVNWLRMIVDEGHSMGKGTRSSSISFASWIHAERRWVMTGTPTRQTISQTGLQSIRHLLHYLGHGFFSRREEGDTVWSNLVFRSWNCGDLASFYRLQALLSLLMVRHTKMDIEELPPPQYKTTVLPMSLEEVTAYNTLVCGVQSNLLITSMEGKTSGAQDSFLDKSQSKHAKRVMANIRQVCAGGTQMLPTLDDKNWTEFMRDFKLCNPPKEKLASVQQYLSRAVTGGLSACGSCGMMLSTLLVFPCGDLVCAECVDRDSRECVVCSKPFDVDLFQRLQPGMRYEWLHNVQEELKKKKKKGEGTHVWSASAADPIIQLEGGAGVLAPLDPIQPRRRSRKPGDGHACVYSPKITNGGCTLCWKQHDCCNFMMSRHCNTCFQRAEDCPKSETKSLHVVTSLLGLYNQQQSRGQQIVSPTSTDLHIVSKRPLKAIVFSQFRDVLNMTGDKLLRRFGSGCIAEYWGEFRSQELSKFIRDDTCFCMILGRDGSEGLDLSFVTHIFFMEELWDRSLQEQAVARAWRMGAKGPVVVETLVAQDSVEETMAEMEKRSDDSDLTIDTSSDLAAVEQSKLKSAEYQRTKLQYLLKGLKLVRNRYASSYGVNKRSMPIASSIAEPVAKKQRTKERRVRFEE
mmetsp:Transcript_33377/g.80752  ORF Transcript_33377/g.80752 Transcript_33377/m.80752 type:complete len:1956 (-) Transcript_33377:162-6029(-)